MSTMLIVHRNGCVVADARIKSSVRERPEDMANGSQVRRRFSDRFRMPVFPRRAVRGGLARSPSSGRLPTSNGAVAIWRLQTRQKSANPPLRDYRRVRQELPAHGRQSRLDDFPSSGRAKRRASRAPRFFVLFASLARSAISLHHRGFGAALDGGTKQRRRFSVSACKTER